MCEPLLRTKRRAAMPSALHRKPLEGYEFVREITTGRSGSDVFVARHSGSGREVVLKLDDPRALAPEIAFNCHANALGDAKRMFPGVIDFGIADKPHPRFGAQGRAFLAMQMVGGATLDAFLEGRLPPYRDALSVVFQIAFALRELWRRHRVRHCDLHAGNVLVDVSDRYGRRDGRFVLKGTKHEHVFDLSGCPKVRIIDMGLSQRAKVDPVDRAFATYVLRLYQMYLRPSDIAKVRLKIRSGHKVSRELVEYMKANTGNTCNNHRSDIEAVLGIEDVLLRLYDLDGDHPPSSRIPAPGAAVTYFSILSSGRFDPLRKRGRAR